MLTRSRWLLLIVCLAVSWGALGYLIWNYDPTPALLTAFFPLFFLATFWLASLVFFAVYAAVPAWRPRTWHAALRQGGEVAGFLTVIALMQLVAKLDTAIVLGVGLIFVLLEAFFRQRVP